MDKHGIENLKKAIKTLSEIGEQLEPVLEDGKITIFEAMLFADELIGVVQTLSRFKDIMDEARDLSDEEITELQEYFAKEFDLEGDDLEAVVENGINLLLQAGGLLQDLRNFATALKILREPQSGGGSE